MKIGVLTKQVPSADSPLKLDGGGKWIGEENVTFAINESDAYALEEALRIKEETGDGEVVVASLGPQRVQRGIREGLSKGADRGIHIEESLPYTSDPFLTATLFANTLRNESFDLILSGLQSDDLGLGQVGVLLGEMLSMSTATLVMETGISDSTIRVKRELEGGWFQWTTLKLPASISIQSGINTPRYPSLKGIMGAKKKEIRSIARNEVDDGGATLQTLRKVYIPQKVKRTEMIEGEADQVVAKLIDIFKRDIKVL
ncbi:MAG TPA: electron transfer flavoprotein subunit beta/FixA family protein [Candidatus Marinimicrobia bacterium]|nr:electron transfer flavoprotein subunit beta/FixA family protein [Candidatus Neomarinimicrobiota bacterium]